MYTCTHDGHRHVVGTHIRVLMSSEKWVYDQTLTNPTYPSCAGGGYSQHHIACVHVRSIGLTKLHSTTRQYDMQQLSFRTVQQSVEGAGTTLRLFLTVHMPNSWRNTRHKSSSCCSLHVILAFRYNKQPTTSSETQSLQDPKPLPAGSLMQEVIYDAV